MKRMLAASLVGLLLSVLAGISPVEAQSQWTNPNGSTSPGSVLLLPNSGGPPYTAAPVGSANPLAVDCVSGCAASGGGTSSAYGAAFPADGTAAGLSDGTNMVSWKTANGLGDAATGANIGGIAAWYFNGTSWDRARGDTTNGLWVNVKTSALPTGAATDTTLQATQGSATGGTAAANATLAGGIYRATPPTLTDAQQAALQLDSSGYLLTHQAAGSVSITGSVTVQGGGTAGSPGTAALTVQGIGGGTAIPVSAASLPLPSGAATSALQSAVQGTAGSPATAVVSVQGVASGTAVPVSAAALPLPSGAATSANQTAPQGTVAPGTAATASLLQGCVYNTSAPAPTNGQGLAVQCDSAGRQIGVDAATVAQGSTTSGQLGQLMQGAVTTNSPTYTNAQTSPLSIATNGGLRMQLIASGGGAITGQTPADAQTNAVTAFNTAGFPFVFNGTTWDRLRSAVGAATGTAAVANTAATSGGATPYSLIVANNTTGISIKGSAGQVYDLQGFSTSTTTILWVKLYDTASAPTCGSGTPIWRGMIPAPAAGGGGMVPPFPVGKTFSSGIGLCVTAGIADNDTTAPPASTATVNLDYK